MSDKKPAKITKGYARGLIAALSIFAVALLIASWGMIGLAIGVKPVTSPVSSLAAPLIVVVNVAFLAWFMWIQTLSLLRGSRPAWSYLLIVAGAGYLVWSLGGLLTGMSIPETWLSPFALAISIIWALTLGIFWALLLRKIYSNKETPKWPWEDRDEEERRAP